MRALVLHGPYDLRLEDIPCPEPSEGQVLLKVHRAGICNSSDLHMLRGVSRFTFPYTFGHEACGSVVAANGPVPDNADPLEKGQRVAYWFSLGAFAEYVLLDWPDVAISPIPDTISDEEGPTVELLCACLRSLCAILPEVPAAGSRPLSGQRVLILGQGPAGLIFLQLTKAFGASYVAVADIIPARLDMARDLGVDRTVNPNESSLEVAQEVDLVIDAMGNDLSADADSAAQALRLLCTGGKYLQFGLPTRPRIFHPRDLIYRGVSICAAHEPRVETRNIMRLAVEMAASDDVNLSVLVSHRVKLEEVPRAVRMIRDHRESVLKVIVEV